MVNEPIKCQFCSQQLTLKLNRKMLEENGTCRTRTMVYSAYCIDCRAYYMLNVSVDEVVLDEARDL